MKHKSFDHFLFVSKSTVYQGLQITALLKQNLAMSREENFNSYFNTVVLKQGLYKIFGGSQNKIVNRGATIAPEKILHHMFVLVCFTRS